MSRDLMTLTINVNYKRETSYTALSLLTNLHDENFKLARILKKI